MIHNKNFLFRNKLIVNFTSLIWKKKSGWRSLTKFPVNDDNSLKRKRILFTRANGWAFTRMKSLIRHSSFVVPRVTLRLLLQRYNIYHPLPVQCFTIGKHSRCLRTWENPNGRMNDFYHKVKIMCTNRGPTREGVKEEVVFFYGKVATLG
jgi:hypothetical protein